MLQLLILLLSIGEKSAAQRRRQARIAARRRAIDAYNAAVARHNAAVAAEARRLAHEHAEADRRWMELRERDRAEQAAAKLLRTREWQARRMMVAKVLDTADVF
jgi:type II secretory pathway predicted ATPase ExeA